MMVGRVGLVFVCFNYLDGAAQHLLQKIGRCRDFNANGIDEANQWVLLRR